MSVDVTAETVIHRPRAAVAVYVLDPANLAQWRGDVALVQREHPGPVAPGSRYLVRTKSRLREVDRVDEVLAHDAFTHLHLRTVLGGPPLDVEVTLSPELRSSTHVALRTTGTTTGTLAGLTGALLERSLRRTAAQDLGRLKTILEADTGA